MKSLMQLLPRRVFSALVCVMGVMFLSSAAHAYSIRQCNAAQQARIVSSINEAYELSDRAVAYLQTGVDSETLYQRWFDGSGQQRNWAEVRYNFERVKKRLGAGSHAIFKCNNSCSGAAYAGKGSPVTLCSGGPGIYVNKYVLIHELTHQVGFAGDCKGKPVDFVGNPNKSSKCAGNYTQFVTPWGGKP